MQQKLKHACLIHIPQVITLNSLKKRVQQLQVQLLRDARVGEEDEVEDPSAGVALQELVGELQVGGLSEEV